MLADTHVRVGGSRALSAETYRHLADAELILHAGDVLEQVVLDELGGFARVEAVLGNNDADLVGVLPETRIVDVEGYTIAMIHDSGTTAGRAKRMYKVFPNADLVIFGHSHLPFDETGVDGQRLFNPGSATWKRQAPTHTIGLLDVVDGVMVNLRHVDV